MPDDKMPDDKMPDETAANKAAGQAASPRFALGRPVATVGAMAAVVAAGVPPQSLLARHARGDWGDRLLSYYRLKTGEAVLKTGEAVEAVWVITEADRSATTLLLPSEY